MSLRFEAIIRPQKAEQLCIELCASDLVTALQATECQGSGTRSPTAGSEADLLPKVAVSGIIEEEDKEAILEIIRHHASTGRRGDGKIFVSQVLSES